MGWLAVAIVAMFMSGICIGYVLKASVDLTNVRRML